MATINIGPWGQDLGALDVGSFYDGVATLTAADRFSIRHASGEITILTGWNFTYGQADHPVDGTVAQILRTAADGQTIYDITNLALPASTLEYWVEHKDTAGALGGILVGADTFNSPVGALTVDGASEADVIVGGAANDFLDGGAGNDTLVAGDGADSLRGLDDNDFVDGGAGNDNLNGNRGQDTVHGGSGADTILGGQGDDFVYGEDGDDPHVNGNLGADTVYGGAGADSVYGGQGDDFVSGDDGDDYVSGDLGADTISGGGGADTIHLGANGGHDVVTDFHPAEGDHIVLDHGATYTAAQVGGDAVLTLATGAEITVIGISIRDTPDSGWVVVA